MSLDAGYVGTLDRGYKPEETANYVIWVDNNIYKAKNGQTGAVVSSTNFKTFVEALFIDHTKIEFKPGTYEVIHHDGIDLNSHHSISIIGSEGVVFKKNEAAGVTGQVMQVMGCTDITIDGIIFDQDHSNPNHQHEAEFGLQWIWREGNTSDNIWIKNCKFINGLGCGVVTGDSHHVHFLNCEVNWCGEHPWYFYQTDWLYMERCRTYSWAKLCRGYGPKLDTCNHTYFSHNEWFANKDGTGPATSGFPIAEYGIYGPVLGGSYDVHFTDDDFIGDGTGTDWLVAMDITNSDRVYFEGCKFFEVGVPVMETWTSKDIEFKGCYFEMDHYAGANQFTFYRLIDCTIVDFDTLYCLADNALVENCQLRWVDRTSLGVLTNFNSKANPRFNHNLVIGYTVYGPYFVATTDGQCIDNIFSSGLAADYVVAGTRTRVRGNVNFVTEKDGVTTILSGTSSILVNLSGLIVNISGSPTTVITSVNTSGYGDLHYYPSNFNSGSFTIYSPNNTSAAVLLSYSATYIP